MRIRTLGVLRLEGAAFNRPKPLLLLAYIALEGPKSRRLLAELFFPEARDPRDTLSTTLKRLRETLGDALHLEGDRVWTSLPCDAHDLLEHLDAQRCDEIVATKDQGSFLDGLDLTLGEELEEWVFGTRELLAARVRGALLGCAEAALTRGERGTACAHVEAALKLPGAPELEAETYARAYTLLVAGGSPLAGRVRAEAAELGLELSPTPYHPTRIPDASPFVVPGRTLSFVGRSAERAALKRILTDPERRLITLHGPGGVGKSRLAIQGAYDQRDAGGFPGGVFFVPLDGLTSRDEVIARLGELFGLPGSQGEDVTALTEQIGAQTLLLILDNYEHLEAAFDLPNTLLSGCPNLKVLVTSRETLCLEQEWVLPLRGLSLPETAQGANEARRADALVLFEQRARKARPDFKLEGPALTDALELCRLVEGYPLEIELAASWVHAAPLSEVLAALQDDPALLHVTARDTPERHRSIEGVFEQSWGLLSATEQRAAAHLAAFHGGFTRHAASRVADATLPLLATLLNKSFFWLTDRGRYEQHKLLRQFACKKLLGGRDSDAVFARHAAYYADFVERHSEGPEAIEAVGQELDNILAAARWALEAGRLEVLVRIMHLLTKEGSYFAARGHTEQSLRLLEEAGKAAEWLGDFDTAHYLVAKAGDAYREIWGDLARAAAAYERALELARLAKNRPREAILLSQLGTVCAQLQTLDAHTFLNEAYKLAVTIDDIAVRCSVLQHRSYVAYLGEAWQEMHDSAREATELARTLPRGVEQQSHLFFSQLNWGEALYRLQRFEAARALYEETLAIAQRAKNELWLAYAHYQLGDLYHTQQDCALATYHLQQALILYRKNNVRAEEAVTAQLLQNVEKLQTSSADSPLEPHRRSERSKNSSNVTEVAIEAQTLEAL